MGDRVAASPLRWVGGKSRWTRQLRQLFQLSERETLCEPFVGGGSVALALQPRHLIAGDANQELISFFEVARDDPVGVLERALAWPDDEETFRAIREFRPASLHEHAARFLYLNRTAFLGMYRVNRRGEFNVPYGGGGRLAISDLSPRLVGLSATLNRATLFCDDFETVLGKCSGDEMVFLDPPYGTGDDKPFSRYSDQPFTLFDHERMASAADRLCELGCPVTVALPAQGPVLELFGNYRVVHARRSTSRFGSGEVIVIDPVFFDRAVRAQRRTLAEWAPRRRWHDRLL